ncbi:MAG: aldo/keto reductase [Pontimonas sp.]|jgi:D-threo-aldose 1-dehydrogenase|tara:strand:+ start:9451 stop:10431 length:981 start_codon:yes stop_codon:yes gene_type:complete
MTISTAARPFGRINTEVSLAALGTVALGNMGVAVSDAQSRAVIESAWQGGVRLFDTAPMYGHGLAEYRLAEELRSKPRNSYFLVNKVGRTLTPGAPASSAPWVDTPPFSIAFDYSYDGVLRQVEESLQRMGASHFDALLVHDIDRFTHGNEQPRRFREAVEGAFRALVRLRDEGVTRAIGVGANENDVCLETLSQVDIDCMLIAGTYNLLDRSAGDELLPACLERGVAVINGRVFGSGILATGPTVGARFNYATAPAAIVERVSVLQRLCDDAGAELGALAVQFGATHPAIASVCLGARTVEQQECNLRWLATDIPDYLWAAVADL